METIHVRAIGVLEHSALTFPAAQWRAPRTSATSNHPGAVMVNQLGVQYQFHSDAPRHPERIHIRGADRSAGIGDLHPLLRVRFREFVSHQDVVVATRVGHKLVVGLVARKRRECGWGERARYCPRGERREMCRRVLIDRLEEGSASDTPYDSAAQPPQFVSLTMAG